MCISVWINNSASGDIILAEGTGTALADLGLPAGTITAQAPTVDSVVEDINDQINRSANHKAKLVKPVDTNYIGWKR